MRRLILQLIVAFILTALATAAEKKLIEFGWDEPDPEFMRAHADQLEASPFQGCVFHVDARKADGSKAGSFTWDAWGTRKFTMEELAPALAELKAAKLRRCKHNFLRFNTTPAKLDWFDDHAAVIQNAELAARFAREAGCPGLLFDIEQYDGPLFDYRKQRDAATRSWDVYAAQARQRGREVMAAFQRGYPGLEVFLTFGYSLPWAQCGGKKEKLPDAHYGMLAPLMDGLVDGATGETKLIDGHELSYGYKDPQQFVTALKTMREGVLPIVADTNKYKKAFSFSFGIWMDQNWRKHGWDTNDFSKNYFTPETFEAALRKALELADEYVWIYTETPRWWSKDGGLVKLPAAYDAAVRRTRSVGKPAY
jgi:hypothetical protein